MADDNRFKILTTDPRYRLPNRKESRTAVDPRFKRLFTDQEFRKKASVDRYGRKIRPGSSTIELEKLYRLDDNEGRPKQSVRRDEASNSSEEEEVKAGLVERDSVTPIETRDPARDGGFSESSSEEEETSEEEKESDVEELQITAETAGQEQSEEIPTGEVSRRIAVVNLDWDNIRAADIMAVASSFSPQNGKIESVTIYPSEFGRERLEREEIEGPPKEVFKTSAKSHALRGDNDNEQEDDDSEGERRIRKKLLDDQTNDGEEFDTTKLRKYQLERLRYYYAIISCDTKSTAKTLYDSMDGREYLSTANFFDLRFVPDETSFDDDQPTDQCTHLPSGYKPNDFRTEALTHSKVRLTWDDDDATRKEVQKRAFSRAEIDENDLQAYIGNNSSSDAESTTSRKSAAEQSKAEKKAAERQKMRAALGLGHASKPSKKHKDEPVGDMQITFTSGLSGGKDGRGVFENEPQDEESTRARYVRKERERKQRRKEKMKAVRAGETEGGGGAEESVSDDEEEHDTPAKEEADPFDDPFFNDPAAAAKAEKAAKKVAKRNHRSTQSGQDDETKARRAELELLMADDQADSMRHFDMREIEKAKKEARRAARKGKKRKDRDVAVIDDFEIETQDPRFKNLFNNHEFAIDPTNPRFKGTDGMKALLEEGRRKRKMDPDDDLTANDDQDKTATKSQNARNGSDFLDGLIKRLKTKSKPK